MPRLYDLERDYRAALCELDAAERELSAARRDLIERPVPEAQVREAQEARRVVNQIFEQFRVADERLASCDRTLIGYLREIHWLRNQLARLRAYQNPVYLTAVCAFEVIFILGICCLALRGMPFVVGVLLFLVFAVAAVVGTLALARALSQSTSGRVEYILTELQNLERGERAEQEARVGLMTAAESVRARWQKADSRFQVLRREVRRHLIYEDAVSVRDAARSRFERIREEFERANVERRLRLLETPWRQLADRALERFIRDVLEALGYQTELTRVTGDQGIDVIATNGRHRIGVQCKGYEGTVGNKAVQEAVAGGLFYRCDLCVALTTSSFTAGARQLASGTRCILIEGDDIPRLIQGQLKLEELLPVPSGRSSR
jgi:hypothetical protein